MMEKFEEFPGVNFNFSQLIRDNVEEALSGVKGANSVKLFGTDLKTLEETGQRVANILQTVPGIENVGLFHIVGQPNLEIEIDRDRCARYGVNVADVEAVVQVAIGGRAFSQMVEGEKLYDIVLRLPLQPARRPQRHRPDPDRRPPDRRRPARPADPARRSWPRSTRTSRGRRTSTARTTAASSRSSSASATATSPRPSPRPRRRSNDPKAGAKLPPGYRIEWSGEFAQMQEANARLMWIIPLSIVLIMVLLYTAFNSIKDALLVMVNVIAATMGGVWALALTGTPFSISAAVGFISIFGVAVQDGVLLISYFNQMRRHGYPVLEAVMRGAELRVRPVVMTSLTAALGLLPAALATSIGSQAQKPLAIVVVGGMLVTLFLTRYLMPVLYSLFPGPVHEAGEVDELAEGSHYTDEFLPALLGRQPNPQPTRHATRQGRRG